MNVNENIDLAYLGDLNPEHTVGNADREAMTAERTACERDWNINLQWVLGQPWYRRGFRGDIEWIKPEFRDNYFHVNMLFPRIMTLVGNEMYIPRFEARPKASPQLEDVMRARAAADVANHGVAVSDAAASIADAHIHKHIFGLTWLEVGWDTEAGPIGPVYEQAPCDMCGGLGATQNPSVPGGISPCLRCGAQGIIPAAAHLGVPPPGMVWQQNGEAPKGDLQVWHHPPWEVKFDPNAKDPFKARWLKHDYDLDKSLALEMYGEGSGLTIEDLQDASVSDTLERHYVAQMPGVERQSTARKDMTRVQRYFRLPTKKHPRGLYIVMIGGRVAKAGALPYAHRKIPFVPLRCHAVPQKMYPKSTVDHLMPQAVFTNELLTRLYQRAQQSVQMRLLAVRGSAIELTDIQGLMEFDHKPGKPSPQFVNDTGAAPDAMNMVKLLTDTADEISFTQDVLRGEASGQTDNARFAAFREQRAINPLKFMIQDNARSFTLMGRLLCDTAKLFYTPDRVIRSVYGSHGHAKFYAFDTSTVGSSDDFELMPVRDIGRSLASRREELYEAKKSGVLDDPRTMKLAEFAVESELYDETQTHEAAAMLENERFRAGQMPDPPSKYEKHDVHIPAHSIFLAELRMTLGAQHPVTLAAEQHIDGHVQMQAQEQFEQQVAMQQASQAIGQINASDPNAQPEATQQQMANIIPQGEPGGVETQPALQQIDNQI